MVTIRQKTLFLRLIKLGYNNFEALTKAGISRQLVRHWMQNEKFMRQYRENTLYSINKNIQKVKRQNNGYNKRIKKGDLNVMKIFFRKKRQFQQNKLQLQYNELNIKFINDDRGKK